MASVHPSVRQQLDAALSLLEAQFRAGGNHRSSVTLYASGITFDDMPVPVVISVHNRHKMVFGKRMLGYNLELAGAAAPFTADIKNEAGRASLGLCLYIDRRVTFLKWASASVQRAAEMLQVEYQHHPEARPRPDNPGGAPCR